MSYVEESVNTWLSACFIPGRAVFESRLITAHIKKLIDHLNGKWLKFVLTQPKKKKNTPQNQITTLKTIYYSGIRPSSVSKILPNPSYYAFNLFTLVHQILFQSYTIAVFFVLFVFQPYAPLQAVNTVNADTHVRFFFSNLTTNADFKHNLKVLKLTTVNVFSDLQQ